VARAAVTAATADASEAITNVEGCGTAARVTKLLLVWQSLL
jgi:hypothetical protein